MKMLILIAALAVTGPAYAASPNIEAGLWTYQIETAVRGDVVLPLEAEERSECIRQDEIEDGSAFAENIDTCQVINRNIGRDDMHVILLCETQGGGSTSIDTKMEFNGYNSSGEITMTVKGEMGHIVMHVTMDGYWISADC